MGNTLLRYDVTTDPFPLQASPSHAPSLTSNEVGVSPGLDAGQTELTDDLSAQMQTALDERPQADSRPGAFDSLDASTQSPDASADSLGVSAPMVAVLTVVASNPNADPGKNPVTVQGLSITIPVGPNATDLTADGTKLGPVPPDGWTLTNTKLSAGIVEFIFTPQAGQGAVGKKGLVFTFNTVTINSQPGTSQLIVKEGSTGNPTKSLFVTKFPNGWGSVSFWLNPTNVPFQGSTTLNWEGPAGATYTIQYAIDGQVYNLPAEGDPPLGSEGQYPAQGGAPLTLDQTTVFTLSVEEVINGSKYHAQEQKTASVQVPAPSITTFTASPAIVNALNPQPVKLQWTTTNVSEIVIGNVGNFSGAQAAAGSTSVSPSVAAPVSTFTYFATAYGLSGYSGPPALDQAGVLFTWSDTSSWCDVWNASTGDFWSLKLWDGRDALDLSLVVTDNQSGQFREVYANLPVGVLVANFGAQGINTPASAWANPQYGSSYPNSRLYVGVGEYDNEQTMNVGQTWGLKFPDGRLVLLWYASGNSDGGGIFGDKWQFTFGWTYFNPHSS